MKQTENLYHLISHNTIKKARNETQENSKAKYLHTLNNIWKKRAKYLRKNANVVNAHTQTNLASGAKDEKFPQIWKPNF